MAKSLAQIQKDSDDKRGVKAKTYKLKTATIDLIEQTAEQQHLSKAELIEKAVQLYVEMLASNSSCMVKPLVE